MVRVTVNVPEAAAAVPEIKQRMLDAGCTAPLIGDFHYNGHLLLTQLPRLRARARQVPHQPRQRRHRPAARRAVLDDLQGGRRPRQAGPHRRQRRLPQPGARHGARCRRTRTAVSAGRRTRSSTSAWCCRRCESTELALECGLREDQIIISCKVVAAARPDRRLPRLWRADRPAAAPRAHRGGHGHQGAGLVGVRDGRPAATRASATRSACR